jgi:hypothetical protein
MLTRPLPRLRRLRSGAWSLVHLRPSPVCWHRDGRLAALIALGDIFEIEAPEIEVVDVPPQSPPPAQRTPNDQELPAPESGVAFRIPILMLEGWETSDGRYWEPGTVGRRDLPQTLMAMRRNPDGGFEGHDAAIINGRIDHAERFDAAEELNRETGQPFGPGVWAWRADGWLIGDTEETASTIRYVRDGVLRGVSVDLAEATYEIDVLELDADGWPVRDRVRFTQSSIAQATLTPSGAFPGAYIELADEAPLTPEQLPAVAAARDTIRLVRTRPLVASAGPAPINPPAGWFTNQRQANPDRHVYLGRNPDGTPTGQVWGYVARWGVPHAAIRRRVYPPRLGAAGYRTFLSGSVLTAEGTEVATGPLSFGGGHCMDLRAGVQAALAHYDNASTAYADVTIGEDEVGIWYAGAMRPSLSREEIETFGRHPLSGDWRGDPGDVRERLCAVLSVNTAGFPMARADSSGGLALVAAGALSLGGRDGAGVDEARVQAAIDRAVAPVLASAARSALARLTRRG